MSSRVGSYSWPSMKKVLPSSVSEKMMVRWRVIGSASHVGRRGADRVLAVGRHAAAAPAGRAVFCGVPDTTSVASRTSGFGSPCGPVSTASVRTA